MRRAVPQNETKSSARLFDTGQYLARSQRIKSVVKRKQSDEAIWINNLHIKLLILLPGIFLQTETHERCAVWLSQIEFGEKPSSQLVSE